LGLFYVALHLTVWFFLDLQIAAQIWADIIKRPYVTFGMAGFLLMIPLAVTLNNYAVRKLGPKWRQIHKLNYVIAILGGGTSFGSPWASN
jgi:sulfoxide reductase heme-binding subunit YedZ